MGRCVAARPFGWDSDPEDSYDEWTDIDQPYAGGDLVLEGILRRMPPGRFGQVAWLVGGVGADPATVVPVTPGRGPGARRPAGRRCRRRTR